jgi:hypothetical protein
MPSTLNLVGPFYAAYKAANSSFGIDTFRCAEETADELLKTATTSDNPGMLLGRVQSGKTRTFISILALAFDNDFDIAIVLSKNSRALIEQTAKRLNNEFKMFIDDGELEVYDIMHAPESFGAFELASKLLFVAKKQSDNLRRLIDLFSSNSAMASKRTIIVDDEADNASIGDLPPIFSPGIMRLSPVLDSPTLHLQSHSDHREKRLCPAEPCERSRTKPRSSGQTPRV